MELHLSSRCRRQRNIHKTDESFHEWTQVIRPATSNMSDDPGSDIPWKESPFTCVRLSNYFLRHPLSPLLVGRQHAHHFCFREKPPSIVADTQTQSHCLKTKAGRPCCSYTEGFCNECAGSTVAKHDEKCLEYGPRTFRNRNAQKPRKPPSHLQQGASGVIARQKERATHSSSSTAQFSSHTAFIPDSQGESSDIQRPPDAYLPVLEAPDLDAARILMGLKADACVSQVHALVRSSFPQTTLRIPGCGRQRSAHRPQDRLFRSGNLRRNLHRLLQIPARGASRPMKSGSGSNHFVSIWSWGSAISLKTDLARHPEI